MAQQLIDDNSVLNFIDDNSVPLFIDDAGFFLGDPPSAPAITQTSTVIHDNGKRHVKMIGY